MSELIVFLIKNDCNYKKYVRLSNKIVSYCLSKHLGVSFNFLGYGEDLINRLKPVIYFAISDDFLHLNSESVNTSKIEQIDNDVGKLQFCKRFVFFDEVCDILSDFKLNYVSLMIIANGGVNELEEFQIVNCKFGTVTETLYKSVIDNKDKYAYDFPDIILNITK